MPIANRASTVVTMATPHCARQNAYVVSYGIDRNQNDSFAVCRQSMTILGAFVKFVCMCAEMCLCMLKYYI